MAQFVILNHWNVRNFWKGLIGSIKRAASDSLTHTRENYCINDAGNSFCQLCGGTIKFNIHIPVLSLS